MDELENLIHGITNYNRHSHLNQSYTVSLHQMQDQDEFKQLFQLQMLYLNQEVTKELEERNITQKKASQMFIQLCKQSSDVEQFHEKVFARNPNLTVSHHFLTSLYHTIKQKLPRKITYQNQASLDNANTLQQNHYKQQQKLKNQDQVKFDPSQQLYNVDNSEKIDYSIQHAQPHKSLTKQSFPSLALPNNDQIDLDLDLNEPIVTKIQNIKQMLEKQESDAQKYAREKELSPNRSQSKLLRKRSRSRSTKRKKNRSRSYSDHSSHQQQRKRKDHHKEHKKDKKNKKHKKHKRSSSRQSHRSKSSQNQRQKVKDKRKSNSPRRPSSPEYNRTSYEHKPKLQPPQIKQGSVIQGRIKKVEKFGCIVTLLPQSKIATLHSSQIKQGFTGDPATLVKQNAKIWVKVISLLQNRIRVSMKGINQYDGRDTNANLSVKRQYDSSMQEQSGKDSQRDPHKNSTLGTVGQLTGIKLAQQDQINHEDDGNNYGELWEISRLGYMGRGMKMKPTPKEDIEEVNIEVDDREPPFLKGQTTKAGINLSPVRIVKNPQGTLQRQAQNAIQYAKERRQIREKIKTESRNEMTKILDEVIPEHNSLKKNSKRTSLTIKQQRQSLPIFHYRDQLIKACMDNRILIVIGETGSGKTTQITQYLHQAGFTKRGKIGCTQPRRVAAMSVAKRVCEEMDVVLGQEVGYSIRFEDFTSSKTVIKYMTDGMLLREALLDKYLSQYSCIMLDEAHERTIHTDVLFGILKNVAQKRKDFTLIVTSATLQAKKFSSYFFDCKIFSIPGRTYNVEILYAKQPQTDYLDAALMCVLQIHIDEPPGDILLFLTGQEQIDTACQVLNERMKKLGPQVPELIALPVYSALPSQLQSKIFDPAPKGKRKCVIATNIAEASLTIDGIYYVVDPGFCKVKIFNSKLGMDTLVVAPISQASAKQRAGRAGRTGPGKCYRLYTQQAYQTQMLPTSIPQIQRANLSNTVLELKAMGINDLINFDFMDAPPVQTLIAALQQLYYLSALDDQGLLTKLGRKMAEFPLEPPLSKMLLTSIDFGCTEEIATIISLLSVQNIFYRPKEKEGQADQKKTKFLSAEGDHLTYLAIFQGWKKSGFSQSWCHDNYIQLRSLKRAMDVKKQIIDLLERYRFPIKSCNGNTTLIRKTITSGFFFHSAKKDPKGGYRTQLDDHQVYIHPSSSLFNKEPEWVIYHELIFTSKQYMRDVCTINPKWLIDVAPNFFKFTDEIGFTRKKRNQKLDPLNQKYGDPNAWRLSKRRG